MFSENLKALRKQRKKGNLTGKQFREMSKNIKGMSVSQFTTWFYQEQSSLDAFRYEELGIGDNNKSLELRQIQTSLNKFKNQNGKKKKK